MRILWTLLKVIIGLAIAIPLGIIALVMAVGILGRLLGLAVLTLKLAGATQALRLAADGPDVATTGATFDNPGDAWAAAFELYRSHVVI